MVWGDVSLNSQFHLRAGAGWALSPSVCTVSALDTPRTCRVTNHPPARARGAPRTQAGPARRLSARPGAGTPALHSLHRWPRGKTGPSSILSVDIWGADGFRTDGEAGWRELAWHLTGGGCPSHEEVKARKRVAEPPGKLCSLPGQQLDTTCEQGSSLRRVPPTRRLTAKVGLLPGLRSTACAVPVPAQRRTGRQLFCPRPQLHPPAGTPGSLPSPAPGSVPSLVPRGAHSPLRTPQTFPQSSWGPVTGQST